MHSPLVTVGILSFNNALYIRQMLDSVRQQTHPAVQLIINDDCSTDDSAAVIQAWLNETGYPAIFRRSPQNQGLVRSVNAMRDLAEGEFVLWVGSDDWLAPTMLADTVAEFARRGSDCGAVYSDCIIIDTEGQQSAPSFLRHFDPQFVPPPEGNLTVPLLTGFYLPTVTTVVRRTLVEQLGPYDETLFSEDLDMWLRISHHSNFAYLPKVTAAYRVHALSLSQRLRPRLNETFFRIYRKGPFEGPEEWAAARRSLADHAEHYYNSMGRKACSALWFAYQETRSPKLLFFYVAAGLGIPYEQLMRWKKGTK